MTEPLDALAARAESEPFFLASVLAAYARSEAFDDAALAAALGCPPGELAMLRLCRTPRTEVADFLDDVGVIAARFGLDPTVLADAVKRGRVILQLRAAQPGAGFLAAARDHDPDSPPEAP